MMRKTSGMIVNHDGYLRIKRGALAEGLRGTARALRRPIKNGKTFFQLVADGTVADVAARALIEVLRKESLQREALRARFAGRKRPSRDVFEEMGAPMLDEKE